MSEELSRIQQTKIQTKFLLGLAAILLFFTGLASISVYFYAKKSLELEAYDKTELVMTAMAANRKYVREVLRPKMYETLEGHEFIIEAMSSSYISRSVMERVNEELEDFSYRRVAINARNPKYEANELEAKMIALFRDNPQIDEWYGIVENNNERSYMRFKPEYFEQSCGYCHGDPQNAPQKIIEMYGDRRGFHRTPGEVFGVISVGLPVDLSLNRIKESAIVAFMAGIPLILFLYAIISIFFNRFIVQNIHSILDIFRTTLKDEKDIDLLPDAGRMDEISELTDAAKTLAGQLKENRHKLERYTDQLLQGKELLQSVFDGIADPVVLLDRNARIKIVNQEFQERYGTRLDDVLNLTPMDLQLGQKCPLQQCRDIFTAMPDHPVTREVRLSRDQIFLIYFYPIASPQGETDNLICYVKDITEQKKLETKIQQTEKLVSVGQLAAGIAHEINNPLGVILCHIDLLKAESLSAEARKDLEVIEKHAGNCRNIIADLLKFAHQQRTVKKPAEINILVNELAMMIHPQLQKNNIELKLNLAENIPPLHMDSDKIKQVILNLMINSSHAIENNGTISVTTFHDPAASTAVIEIEDSGKGIPDDIVEKIFDPFFTTKSPGKGTGLGLSVSYGIIKDHSGDIRVDNDAGGNTCFVITLPVMEEPDE